MATEFDNLIGAIQSMHEDADIMHKSMPVPGDDDDAKIAAAAADGNADADADGEDDVPHAEPDGDEDGEYSDDDGDEVMGKSFSFQLEDGTTIEALDGTELVKSLMARIETNEGTMAKALGAAVDLIGKQGKMIKSLQDQMTALGASGRGRKAVISVAEKAPVGDMRKSMDDKSEGLHPQEFMAKALSAQAAGKITGLDIARAESALNKGLPVPSDIVARVTQ